MAPRPRRAGRLCVIAQKRWNKSPAFANLGCVRPWPGIVPGKARALPACTPLEQPPRRQSLASCTVDMTPSTRAKAMAHEPLRSPSGPVAGSPAAGFLFFALAPARTGRRQPAALACTHAYIYIWMSGDGGAARAGGLPLRGGLALCGLVHQAGVRPPPRTVHTRRRRAQKGARAKPGQNSNLQATCRPQVPARLSAGMPRGAPHSFQDHVSLFLPQQHARRS